MQDVVLATYNGERTLPLTLERMASLEGPKGGWRLIVVDNNSRDNTKDIVNRHQARLNILYLFCPTQGKNNALNMALEHVQSDLIIFTDDDVLPAPRWLHHYQKNASAHEQYDVFGGPILPFWMSAPDIDYERAIPIGPAYALTPPDLATGPVQPDKIWGANMAVRRHLFDHGLRFNPNVGPAPGQYMMGSETELLRRLAATGTRAWFDTEAHLQHIIRPEQMTRRWLIGRALRFGRSLEAIKRQRGEPPASRKLPRWMLRKIITERLLSDGNFLLRNKERALSHAWQHGLLLGQAKERMRDIAPIKR
ncbi:glycosyltransferase involved in cell wall biosynthesis [Natronocella acetinitrilica]|uniref:Glycosyltransferase involved in cell wall biosynthesis n=1 Tax=Natronocella acetinitrilica TaxID=414046 RepID=A0AAE3G770_9GAMM|nr:glycosyltransferase [Natronocella acetinitrilica]MCP1677140.1 glycosyltransferase involved in cell wall biosynthesis [Natronocella acetinitrilica]